MLTTSLKFFIGLLIGFAAIITAVILSISWTNQSNFISRLFSMDRFLLDALLISTLCYFLYSKHLLTRIASYLFGFTGLFLTYVQYGSISYSGSFFPLIALENAQHASLVNINATFIGLFILILYFLILIAYCENSTPQTPDSKFKKIILGVVLIFIIVGLKNNKKWLTDNINEQRLTQYRTGVIGFEHKSPIEQAISVLVEWKTNKGKLKKLVKEGLALNDKEKAFAFKHNLSWGNDDLEFPLIKTERVHEMDGIESTPFTSPPNVIVFFSEGVSARTIQPYSQKFPEITPNLDKFSKHAIKINNYYNHTFATYRGLAGQHCSIFPHNGTEKETNYYCLPHILNNTGYETNFLYSQKTELSHIDEILINAGISNIYSLDKLSSLPINKGKKYNKYMSDQELFKSLVHLLEQKEEKESVKPFYIGLYNIETHTGFRPFSGSHQYNNTKYPRNQSSYILDTIHNLDYSFGIFWDYFKESKFAENTIVIFTSDHAHYPDKDFRNFWQREDFYSGTFMDKIPLLIYSPYHKQTRKFHNQHSSSLDLAPTILHLLGINKYESMFVGRSIFDTKRRMSPVAMGNSALWYQKGGIIMSLSDTEENPNFKYMHRMIKKSQALELSNRLWKTKKKQKQK